MSRITRNRARLLPKDRQRRARRKGWTRVRTRVRTSLWNRDRSRRSRRSRRPNRKGPRSRPRKTALRRRNDRPRGRALEFQGFQVCPELRAEVFALERKFYRRLEEAELVARVIAGSFEEIPVDRPSLEQRLQ